MGRFFAPNYDTWGVNRTAFGKNSVQEFLPAFSCEDATTLHRLLADLLEACGRSGARWRIWTTALRQWVHAALPHSSVQLPRCRSAQICTVLRIPQIAWPMRRKALRAHNRRQRRRPSVRPSEKPPLKLVRPMPRTSGAFLSSHEYLYAAESNVCDTLPQVCLQG